MRYPFLYKVMGNIEATAESLPEKLRYFVDQNFPEFKVYGPYKESESSEAVHKLEKQSHRLHRLVLNKKNGLEIRWQYNGKIYTQSFAQGDFILCNDQVEFQIIQPNQFEYIFLLDPDMAIYLPEIG